MQKYQYPWEILPHIKDIIMEIGKNLPVEKYNLIGENIWQAKSAKVMPSAYIAGPCIIGEDAEIRHCAFIRGSAIIGNNAVVGNSVELKNCILFNNVQVPHYNYVGDSVLGYKSHLGAGSLTSNLKSDKSLVKIKTDDGYYDTGIKKFGAMVGDCVEVGCNSVLCPGTVIGKNCTVYPLSRVRGQVQENSIFKDEKNIVAKL
ncbi:MAG: UDP-N-acetylglucosamine pyrophosphorylase [Oscillospiraceae bacterium]